MSPLISPRSSSTSHPTTTKAIWVKKCTLRMVTTCMTIGGVLVNRYEEMIENYHPFILFGDYSQRCLRQMDRAYNFVDNQILHMNWD
ncbi:hypothetical protein AHAS_Ahas05G0095500 [Arachis hypogaea]